MMLELNQTSLRLDNTMNKMLSLKNQQFMEARVHDETESSVNTVHNNNAKSVGPVTLLVRCARELFSNMIVLRK